MTLIENFWGMLHARVGSETAGLPPHTLVIAVSGAHGEIWSTERLVQVAQASAATLFENFNTIDFLWGTFFEDWAIDVISSEGSRGLIASGLGDRPIMGGQYRARILLPAALFPASPNPRGNQSGSTHPIEGRIQQTFKAHVHLMHRFLVGFRAGDRPAVENDADDAMAYLRQLVKTVMHLHRVDQKGNDKGLRDDDNADRFIELCIDQGPRVLGRLLNDKTNRLAGKMLFQRGIAERKVCSDFKKSKIFLQLSAELNVLSNAWDRARLIRLGEQAVRRDGVNGPMTVAAALNQPGIAELELQRIAGISKQLPSLQLIADIARRHELDLTMCHPTLSSMRPIASTMIAVSAFERRSEVPSRESVEGVIAHHSIAKMAKETFEIEAKMNDFGQNWPRETLKKLAAKLIEPLPRLKPIVPSQAGIIF
jgi:hypothetical protein